MILQLQYYYIDSQCYQVYTMLEPLHKITLMSGAKSREWVHQKPTNKPTNQLLHSILRLAELYKAYCLILQ